MATLLTDLLPLVRDERLSELECNIKDEVLCPTTALPATVFEARHQNWLATPTPKIKKTDSAGVVTLLITPTDYSINLVTGVVTLVVSTSDTISATYTFSLMTDTDWNVELERARKEVSSAIYRPIDASDIAESYVEAITKRVYTNVLKKFVIPSRDFFSVSIAGRSVDKGSIVSHYNEIIEQNEKQLTSHLNSLRYYNTTKRLE